MFSPSPGILMLGEGRVGEGEVRHPVTTHHPLALTHWHTPGLLSFLSGPCPLQWMSPQCPPGPAWSELARFLSATSVPLWDTWESSSSSQHGCGCRESVTCHWAICLVTCHPAFASPVLMLCVEAPTRPLPWLAPCQECS